MGHNWVLAKTDNWQALAEDAMHAGPENDYFPPGDPRIVAYTDLIGETPLVHLMEPRDGAPADTSGSGVIGHLAFTCTDIAAMKARLEGHGVEYREREAPEDGFTQLFVTDPAGVRVEHDAFRQCHCASPRKGS